jgi:hypothetical protein
LPHGNCGDSWGPSDVELRDASISEVTGSWVEGSGSETEKSESGDDDSDAADAADWGDVDENESDGELMETLEAVACVDEYRGDGTSDVAYGLDDFSSFQSSQRRSSVSPSKCSRNT